MCMCFLLRTVLSLHGRVVDGAARAAGARWRRGGGWLFTVALLGSTLVVHPRGRTRKFGHKHAVDDRVRAPIPFEARAAEVLSVK